MALSKSTYLAIIGVGLTIAVIVAVAVGRTGGDAEAFSWDSCTRGDIRETLTASGEIQAMTKINVGTSVAGEIKALHVKDGQDVKAGDLLVTIDQERLRQELTRTEAALDASRQEAARLEATMVRARETSARLEQLHAQGLISNEDYRQSRLNRESSELALAAAKANIHQAQATVAGMKDAASKAVLRAPIDGRVTSLKAERGETAIPGMSNLPGAVLMVISDMSRILAEVKVNEAEVVRLKPGQMAQVTVEALPGKTFHGKVYEVASAAERSGQDSFMYLVKVELDRSQSELDRLRPGMSARAVILTAEVKNVLRVPLQAVLEREGTLEDAKAKGLLAPQSRLVVMAAKNGKASEHLVETGVADTQSFEVTSGIQEGDMVLTGPIRKLKELKDKASIKLRKKSDTELAKEAERRKGSGTP